MVPFHFFSRSQEMLTAQAVCREINILTEGPEACTPTRLSCRSDRSQEGRGPRGAPVEGQQHIPPTLPPRH